MNTKYRIAFLILLFAGYSCQVDNITTEPAGDGVRLRFAVDQGWGGHMSEAETRAPSPEYQVKDVWIFQFNQEGGDWILTTPQKYTTDMSSPFPFVNRGSSVQRIVAVANLGDENYSWGLTSGISTYDDMLDRVRDVTGETSLYPNGPLLLYGVTDAPVNGTVSPIPFSMKHNAAKIELQLSCNTSDIKITSLQLCNIPAEQWLVGEERNAAFPFPDVNETDLIDYPPVTDASSLPTGSAYRSTIWYMPANMRGTCTNTNPKSKNIYAPAGATYIKVNALRVSDQAPVTYIFHPGANMIDDFNLSPNCHYKIYVRIRGVNEADIDSRIQYQGRVIDMKGRNANSYILNPPATGSVAYRIYPNQVDRFWGVYKGMHEYKLNQDVAWSVKVFWMDSKTMVTNSSADGNTTVTKGTGTGVNDYFEITVPSTAEQGNFLVSLHRTADPEQKILWSWHMWVTDYDPDVTMLSVLNSRFDYPVGNGSVHRYKGDIWETGIYSDSFIMDRNMGSLWSRHFMGYSSAAKGYLFYQFGRNVPFTNSVPIYDRNGLSTFKNNAAGGQGSGVTIVDAVHNPLTIYANLDYTNDTDSQIKYRTWGDKYAPMRLDEINTAPGKSIFDPCPYGWKVPHSGTWQDFKTYSTVANPERGLEFAELRYNGSGIYTNTYYGIRYWPLVSVNGDFPVWGDIRIPASGYYSANNSYQGNSYTRLWSNAYYYYPYNTGSEPTTGYEGNALSLLMNATSTSYMSMQSSYSLMPVRCVTHNESLTQ